MKRLLALVAAVLVTGSALGGDPARAQAPLDWSACGGGFECATVAVPADYDRPDGPTLGLALARLPAADPSKRLGSLLVNPGGPGASGIQFVRLWARTLDSSVRDRFDIVGFDPRGVGGSSPVVCHANLQAYVAADPSPDSQAEWDVLRAETEAMADECAGKYGSLLQHLGTKDVARDLDRIRAAVGDEKLTYLGYSYGTSIGQVYADMFPAKVRAMVLDGAVDLSLDTGARALTQAEGFERALQSFLADCREDSCPLADEGDPAEPVEQLLARVEEAPIPAPGRDRPAGPGETLLGLIEPLYAEQAWPLLARAITTALDGDGSLLVTLADAYLMREPNGAYPNLLEMNTAVNCVDDRPASLPTEYRDYPEAASRFEEASPHFGAAFVPGLACAAWPVTPDPLGPPTAAGAPPILVVSTTADPATPYEWGVAVSNQLERGVLLTYRGDGHTAYAGGDDCVDSTVNAYLVALTVPPAGTTCGDGPAPGDIDEGAAGASPPRQQPAPAGDPGEGARILRSLAVLGGIAAAALAAIVALRSTRE